MNEHESQPGFGEFVALMAMMMSLAALSIDMTLPALPNIGRDLGVLRANDSQLVISLLFLGFAVGQIFYGPLSDNKGRKAAVYLGFGLIVAGSLCSLFASSFPIMLTGRFLQGLGVAGPRTIVLALVRDRYEGRTMAQVMSFVMAVFIMAPVVAPALGQGIMILAGWRAIFGFYLGLVLVVSVWFGLRQPETLAKNHRIPFSRVRIALAVREVLGNRIAFGYTLAAGLIFGSFIGYLNSSQQIFQQQYGLGRLFPLYFGIGALSVGCASFLNGKLVMRLGMRPLVLRSLTSMAGLSVVFLAIAYALAGHPPLWLLMAYLLIVFFCAGILFGNLNALAMAPMGHIAGTAAAVIGSLSTFLSLVLGTAVGQAYNGTILPLVGGFALFGLASLVVVYWIEHAASEPDRSEALSIED
jgi:DHA1 family bicyclomycin/chloramphenicol resistance-like MFS transporter